MAKAENLELGTTRLAALSILLGSFLLIAAIAYFSRDPGQARAAPIEKAVARASSLRATVSAELDTPCRDVHVSDGIAEVDCFAGRHRRSEKKRASIAVWVDETRAEQVLSRPIEVPARDLSAFATFVRGHRWEIVLYTEAMKAKARELAHTTGGRVVRPVAMDLPEELARERNKAHPDTRG